MYFEVFLSNMLYFSLLVKIVRSLIRLQCIFYLMSDVKFDDLIEKSYKEDLEILQKINKMEETIKVTRLNYKVILFSTPSLFDV